jgi:hypothetical protein
MRYSICFCLLVSVLGCTRKDGLPKEIMPRDQMESILWDMVQADEYSIQYLAKDSATKNVKKETVQLYGEVFRIHHVSKDEFQKSFDYYLGRPDLTKKMLDTLSERARRQRLMANQRPLPMLKAK